MDCIIFATGFEVGTDYTRRAGYELYGRDGVTLTERWADGMQSLHGIHVHGFPNLFIISNGQAAFTTNFPHAMDESAKHISYIIGQCVNRNINTVDAEPEAEDAWVEEIVRLSRISEEFQASCTPGYYNNEGKPNPKSIQNGAYVNAQSGPLTYVAQLDPIWVDFSLSEDEHLKIRKDQKSGVLSTPGASELSVELLLADDSIYRETGRVFFRDANYSTDTGTFLIRATFSNPDGALRPGQFVRVRVKGALRPNAILVTQQAVLQGAQGFFVWIVDGEGKAQTRSVEVGDWQGDNWFVYKGLSDGDRVITDGLVRLAKGTPVKIVQPKAGETEGAVKRDAPAAADKSEAAGG